MDVLILKARCFDLQETITALRAELARAGSLTTQKEQLK